MDYPNKEGVELSEWQVTITTCGLYTFNMAGKQGTSNIINHFLPSQLLHFVNEISDVTDMYYTKDYTSDHSLIF